MSVKLLYGLGLMELMGLGLTLTLRDPGFETCFAPSTFRCQMLGYIVF